MRDPADIDECPCANDQECWVHGVSHEPEPPAIPDPADEWDFAAPESESLSR